MVARLLDACGVLPSGIMTSHMTSTPLVRAASGKTATGLSTQSELWPSACMVDEPSKPHSGSCSSVGNESNSLICVLPRRFGVGVYPSSQIYSSLYFVIEFSHELMMQKVGIRSLLVTTDIPGHHRPLLAKQLKCQSLQCGTAPTGKRSGVPTGRKPAFGVRQSRA